VVRDKLRVRQVVAVAAALGALALPNAAFGGNGLIDQYIEDVPTAGGTHHPGAGAGGTSGSGTSSPTGPTVSLSGSVQTKLDKNGGDDAPLLNEIATSPSYGAPQETSGTVLTPTGSPDPLSAGVSAITDGSDGRMLGLFVALLAVTAGSLGFAAASRRRTI
jgi:hypothetical protein